MSKINAEMVRMQAGAWAEQFDKIDELLSSYLVQLNNVLYKNMSIEAVEKELAEIEEAQEFLTMIANQAHLIQNMDD